MLPTVLFLIALGIFGFYVLAFGYLQASPTRRQALANSKLVHVTTRAAAEAMMDRHGNVWLDPARARLPGVVLSRRGVLRLRRGAHFFRGTPTRAAMRNNVRHRKSISVITVDGEVLQHVPDRHLVWRRNAVALLAGYRGPATVRHYPDADTWLDEIEAGAL